MKDFDHILNTGVKWELKNKIYKFLSKNPIDLFGLNDHQLEIIENSIKLKIAGRPSKLLGDEWNRYINGIVTQRLEFNKDDFHKYNVLDQYAKQFDVS